MDQLPKHIVYDILEYLEPQDFVNCLNSSKLFHPIDQKQYDRKKDNYLENLNNLKNVKKTWSNVFLMLARGMEYLSNKGDNPLGLNFDHYEEEISKNLDEYDQIMEELINKYNSENQSAT